MDEPPVFVGAIIRLPKKGNRQESGHKEFGFDDMT